MGPKKMRCVSLLVSGNEWRHHGPLRHLRLLGRVLGLVVLLVSLDRGAVFGQTFTGRVVDVESGGPVAGALLTAIDQEGRARGGALTDEAGTFTLDLDPGFELGQVRVERIGYATQFFDAAHFSAESDVILRVTSQAIELEGIQAVAESLCGDDIRGGGPVQDLWEEARKSLRITEISQSQQVLRFETEKILRTLSPGDHAVLEGTSERRRVFAEEPYRSIPVEQMTDRGWIEETEDGDLIYYAPDASVLLSEEFTQQHCFSAERTDEAILLRFEPNRSRSDIPEIEGVMSLDPRTKELTELRFSYVAVPLPSGGGGEAGGEVHFYSAPNGLRVVREWAIRMPVVDLIRTGFRGEYSEDIRLRHVREVGGRVLSIRVGDADIRLGRAVQESASFAEDTSSVRHGLTKWTEEVGGGVGVALYLRNDLHVAVQVTSLALWDCRNVGVHCSRRDVDMVVSPGESEVLSVVRRDDIMRPMQFQWTYTATNLSADEEDRAAARDDREDRPAVRTSRQTLQGRVMDGHGGSPIAMAYVTLTTEDQRTVTSGTTNDQGLFSLSAPSPGSYYLHVSNLGYQPVDSVFELEEGGSTGVEIRLQPDPVTLDPIQAIVDRTEGYLREVGFYERQDQGWGRHLTHEEVREKATISVVDAIRDMPRVYVAEGATIDRDSPFPSVVMRYGRYRCPPHIFVDGSLVHRGGVEGRTPAPDGPAMPDEFVHPDEIAAMEVYRGSAESPPEYRLPNSCGVVVIWTWH